MAKYNHVTFFVVKDATYDALHDALKNRTVKIWQMNNQDPPLVRIVFSRLTGAQMNTAIAELDALGCTYQMRIETGDEII